MLGLGHKQVQSLRQLQREKARTQDEARFKLRQKQGDLLELLEQENPDGNALVSAVKSIHSLRLQAAETRKEIEAKIAAVLNAEQRTRLKAIYDARQAPRAMREADEFDLVRQAGASPGGPVREQ